jgi:hypothetical protein
MLWGDDRDRLHVGAQLVRNREPALWLGAERGSHRRRVPRRQQTDDDRQHVEVALPQPRCYAVAVGAGL